MTPRDLARRLVQPGTVLLDTARADEENRASLLFTAPRRVLRAQVLEEVPPLLKRLDGAVAAGRYVAGYLAYEAGYAFEHVAPEARGDGPLAWFGVYDAPRVVDGCLLDAALEAPAASCAVRNLRLSIDRAAYLEKIDAIKRHIREGDVYQVNFTDRVRFDVDGTPAALYRALRRRQRVPYGALLHAGEASVLCFSPELFFRREGASIRTRPMKGTVHRGRTPEEDEALRRWLAADAKNRAENLMIVDLLRNDLSRVCVPGSVRVPDLFTVDPFETVSQMTSTVEGRLRPGVGYAALFRALFPCGSVTGAPKIRAMQLIQALEAEPRGVYCGAVGYAAPGADAVFNVAIRTVVLRGGRGVMGTGSGVVWDSDPEAEYEECRLKARFLSLVAEDEEFELIETMRAEAGCVALLALHVDRLRASARFFAFPFDEAAFRALVRETVAGLPAGGAFKVRVTLDRQGACAASWESLAGEGARVERLGFSSERVDSDDVFLYHKTTRRRVYERAYWRARAEGLDEVLLLNERGEVTEGTRTNVFVQQGDRFVTPPLASGLLGGVYRRHLLQTLPRVEERVLYAQDVLEAEAVFLCNAVQGLRRVAVVVQPAPGARAATLEEG